MKFPTRAPPRSEVHPHTRCRCRTGRGTQPLRHRSVRRGSARTGPALGFDKKAKRSKREFGLPCVATLHYLFKELDADRFEQALTRWISEQGRDGVVSRAIAIDGKTLRGTRGHQLPGVHLLAAYAHELGSALVQLKVDAKTNEHKATLQLLKLLPRKGTLITGDAALTQKDVCAAIIEGGGRGRFS